MDLPLYQCSCCGLVQVDCQPVSYYRDVIGPGGYSTTMTELRRKQYRHLICQSTSASEQEKVYRSRMRTWGISEGADGVSSGGLWNGASGGAGGGSGQSWSFRVERVSGDCGISSFRMAPLMCSYPLIFWSTSQSWE